MFINVFKFLNYSILRSFPLDEAKCFCPRTCAEEFTGFPMTYLSTMSIWLWLLTSIMKRCTGQCSLRGSRPEVFLRKGVLKICSKPTGEYPCRSALQLY